MNKLMKGGIATVITLMASNAVFAGDVCTGIASSIDVCTGIIQALIDVCTG